MSGREYFLMFFTAHYCSGCPILLFERLFPRRAIPEFLRFLEQLQGWVDGPPVVERLNVVGSYYMFGFQREESAGR